MKKIVFITGTRADFGKIKPLLEATLSSKEFDPHIFVTGMHLSKKYGSTYMEIKKQRYKNIFLAKDYTDSDGMDIQLAKTIHRFSAYVKDIKPDMIIVHGDRIEALAGAIVGTLNATLTSHIEGGEVSGTVDEMMRHAISKMSHIHLVANQNAKKRLIQMGENNDSVFVIGSPDVDVILSKNLPDLDYVKKRYEIGFDKFSILIFHPVVTELKDIKKQARNLVNTILESGLNYIVIYPNNDKGCEYIFQEYKRLENNERIKIYPSIRFENFLTLLKNADFIIGNSSAGIREAPYYKVPTINIGSRQYKRLISRDIINCSNSKSAILLGIKKALNKDRNGKTGKFHFGDGKSKKLFIELLNSPKVWTVSKQKRFNDLYFFTEPEKTN